MARCHSRRRTCDLSASITVISLLSPRVAVIVIAQRLPEAALVLFHEAQASHPLGALPKIEMRHEQPGRTAMRRQNRQALISGRDHAFTANEIRDGKVRCVTSVTMSYDVGFGWLRETRCFQQIVECHALPCRIELRPLCDAVNVSLSRCLRKSLELRPPPFAELRFAQVKGQSPGVKLDLRRGSRRKDREVRRHILPGRYSAFRGLLLPPRPKAAGN